MAPDEHAPAWFAVRCGPRKDELVQTAADQTPRACATCHLGVRDDRKLSLGQTDTVVRQVPELRS